MTPDGLKKLEEEIEHLSTVRRREVSERIREARDFGDISENAEYDDAKNEQAQLEAQISQLEERLRRSTVEKATKDTSAVGFGSIVHIKDQESGDSRKFQIVGSTEADLAGGKLSSESPIGAALIGGKVNEIVKIPAPKGLEKKFKITKIEAA
ncbi:MAG: transcription elongation factor GreA [Solirubrobacterales bacterium]|nr:transcription elongation factor GreA [Solirubrobacterales bacterium]